MGATIIDLLRRGKRHAATVNFVRRGATTSYTHTELFERAAEIGAMVGLQDLSTGTVVGLLFRSQESQVLFYLACLSAGLCPAILTPFHTRLSRGVYDESLSVALHGSLLTVIASDEDLPGLEARRVELPGLGDLSLHRLPRSSPPLKNSILQFSSGTTALKKGVPIPAEALTAQLETYGDAIAISRSDHILSWLPLYHDMGFIACLNLPLYHGISVTLIDTFDWLASPDLFLHEATSRRATLSWNPNFFYSYMAERAVDENLAGVCLKSLRGLVNCSEPVTLQSQQRFRSRFAKFGLPSKVFWGCYAMAECTFALTHITEADQGYCDARTAFGTPLLSVGSPLPGVKLSIVDERGEILGDRAVGEILASSPFDFAGYSFSSEKAAIKKEYFATGDLGYKVGDRYFIVGRKKDVVIVNGENFYPHQIEEAVGAFPEVLSGRVAAFGEFDEHRQSERLVVLAETTIVQPARTTLILAIRGMIAKAFFTTSVEVHLVRPGTLLKSSSGKISRSRCREWWFARHSRHPSAGSSNVK
jgi:fatty-acyl-CoA synthase